MQRVACVLLAMAVSSAPRGVPAQTVSQRGFVEGRAVLFPQEAVNDATRAVGDFLFRDEVFVKPAPWVQFAGGLDVRANTHDQVGEGWGPDVSDRGARRPRLSVRRLTATLSRGPIVLDVGKQFIRWGKADIVNPTDRFAPRDFLSVVDNEFLAVAGVRASVQLGDETLDAAWVPRFTPSRVPLLDQRWTVVPAGAAAIPLVDGGATLPRGSQAGVRWSHAGADFEYSLSFFNGFNHLPNIESRVRLVASHVERAFSPEIVVTRAYPAIRAYGADAAVQARWFVVKGEVAYVTSKTPGTDEYVLYVVQLERQTGEWTVVGGYAGEVVTERRAVLAFAPDRGLTRSFVGRASYTIDPNRSVAFEGALRQDGRGVWTKAEYSQAHGQHWRTTLTGALIRGEPDDFLGQYRRNSHATMVVRYSF